MDGNEHLPDHESVRQLIGGAVIGQLTPGENILLEAHLSTCRSCGCELADLAVVGEFLASARPRPLTVETPSGVQDPIVDPAVNALQVSSRWCQRGADPRRGSCS